MIKMVRFFLMEMNKMFLCTTCQGIIDIERVEVVEKLS